MKAQTEAPKKCVKQCRTCPWRVGSSTANIPNYDRELHGKLHRTIRSGLETLAQTTVRIMACHHSMPGAEYACAGWLHHQLGPGNNLQARLAVMTDRWPMPEVDGPQHERFEDTICDVGAGE